MNVNCQMIWSEKLCRLCGIASTNQHSVFKHVGSETIEYKIKKCLNFSIFKDDSKPKEICGHCLEKVEQFSDFIDVCVQANQRFDSFILSRTSWPEVRDLSIPEYIQQKSVIVNLKNVNDNYQEPVDLLPLQNINVPLNENVLQIVENSSIYTGNLPENLGDYVNESSRYVPYYSECNNTVLRHSSNVDSVPNNLFTNSDLTYQYSHRVNEELELVDKNCTEYLTSQTHLNFEKCFNEEIINVESIEIRNDCVQTENTIKSQLKENLISVESVRNKLNSTIEIIKPKPKPQKKYKCPHCDRVFLRRISLNSHIAVHTKNRPFMCSKCGKAFPIKSELTIHKKIHSDQYQCKICLKTFVVPSKLERHFRTHTNERPFKCNFENCGKSFSDQSNLIEHKNTHKETRNLKCQHCEKCFKTKNQLKSHKVTHRPNASFTCDICKKSYKYKTNLVFHMKKHTGYFCPYCDINCLTMSGLIKHRKECNKSKET